MKEIMKGSLLKNLVTVPEGYKMSPGDIAYHGSLTPEWSLLSHIRTLNFLVTLGENDNTYLKPNNPINAHIFKPRYFQEEPEDTLQCLVATNDIMRHTIRSLAIVASNIGIDSLVINANDKEDKYIDHCLNWKIHKNVFIGRIESVLNFYRLMWLSEVVGLKRGALKDIGLAYELSRLGDTSDDQFQKLDSKLLRFANTSFKNIDDALGIVFFKSLSPYVQMANLDWHGISISIIQSPWGMELSFQQMQTLVKLNPEIEKIGIVGGVGYLGSQDAVAIDDIFIPEHLIVENKDGHFIKQSLSNQMTTVGDNKYFPNKKVYVGTLKTVAPRLGHISYTSNLLRKIDHPLHAVDMEKEAFIQTLMKHQHISWASIYYIMDIPLKKLGLGNTYYNESFLRNLFSTFNRGKYYCFEKISNYLSH